MAVYGMTFEHLSTKQWLVQTARVLTRKNISERQQTRAISNIGFTTGKDVMKYN